MIQFRRGKTASWLVQKTKLKDGQPGYDKDKHKIKVGDGEHSWNELPYASGLSSEEILSSESDAKIRRATSFLLNPLSALLDSPAVITYGTEKPDKDTIGQLYLQYYDSDPEADHIVEMGSDGIWTYRKWRSGLAECWGTYKHRTSLDEPLSAGTLFYNNTSLVPIKYPSQINFDSDSIPCESATIQCDGVAVWLVSNSRNTAKKTATYTIIGAQEADLADYFITFSVKGRWKK